MDGFNDFIIVLKNAVSGRSEAVLSHTVFSLRGILRLLPPGDQLLCQESGQSVSVIVTVEDYCTSEGWGSWSILR